MWWFYGIVFHLGFNRNQRRDEKINGGRQIGCDIPKNRNGIAARKLDQNPNGAKQGCSAQIDSLNGGGVI